MEVAIQVIDFVLHINRHIEELTANYGALVYAALFVIVFCETGLVFTPFLPGDSLLFAAGAVAVALIASSGRLESTPPGFSVTDRLRDQAVDEGGGNNIVNVVLTDVRALDTLGEVVVLLTVAVGIVSLTRRRGAAGSDPDNALDGPLDGPDVGDAQNDDAASRTQVSA